jgi:6-phosphogluconate dehydrogenase
MPEEPDGAHIAVIGLGVMGQNLALNIEDHGFRVAVYNRSSGRTEEFLAGAAHGRGIVGATDLEELVAALAPPRRLLLMVPAGSPVDDFIDGLLPLLSPGDVVIDGGNSHHLDTERRLERLEASGVHFVGAGVSGGEEGARHGPSIMPGGSPDAWPVVSEILQAIAARADDGAPCCEWIGPGGSGHFVKIVHNGIEYGNIQLLAESYDIMRRGLGMGHDEMADVFDEWSRGRLASYLVEITAAVLRHRDEGEPTLERILDAAGQKGTGRWTVESALELGTPVPLIADAVMARVISSLKESRVAAAEILGDPPAKIAEERDLVLARLEQALYASEIVSYAQGFMLLRDADAAFGWDLDLAGVAAVWRAGCIIRAAFLEDIREVLTADPGIDSLLVAPRFAKELTSAGEGWRRTVATAVDVGIPVPAHASGLAFFDAYRSRRLPANLIQALRDFFGAHTYERVDRPRGESFHTDWAASDGVSKAGS